MSSRMGHNSVSSSGLTDVAVLGQTVDSKGTTLMYCQASAALTAGQAAIVAINGTAQPLTTTLANAQVGASVVIPQFAVAINEYFWAPCGPFGLRPDGSNVVVNALTLDAVNAKQYTSATPGAVDDTATTLISNLFLKSTNATGGTVATPCYATGRLTVGAS
jgi:hypothetical protein